MLLRRQTAIPLLILPLVLGACSLFGKKDDVFDYRTAPRPTRLDVPPDLSQLPKDDRFVVPTPAAAAVPADGAKGASPATPVISPAAVAAVAAPALPAGSVAPANAVARVVQSGKERWLEADAAPELVYAHLRTLWEHAGWKIAVDDPAAGVLETDWKGSRPAPQEDSIRGTLHRLLGALDSPGEQSRLRARFERQGASRTIVHVSERLIVEMPANTQSDHTIWVPKDPTGELEAETLQRLANDLAPVGSIPVVPTVAVAAMAASADATAPAVAPAAAPDANVPTPAGPAGAAHRVNVGGFDNIQLEEPFDRAWRRVNSALDRAGFTVEDRERDKGLFYIRYLDPEYETSEREKRGWWDRVFHSDAKIPDQKFRIHVATTNHISSIEVLDTQGNRDNETSARHIVDQLLEQLR